MTEGRSPHCVVEGTGGVYYRRQDYASFGRRMLVDLIDLAVAGSIAFALYTVIWSYVTWIRNAAGLFMAVGATVGFGYFVLLKRSRFRTAGYRAGGVRIVGMNGEAASWGALIYRLGFAFLGPINWILDLIWLSNDV